MQALGVAGDIVAVRGLGGINVPLAAGITLLDDAAHLFQRRGNHRAAALRAVEEGLLVHLLGLMRVADEDDVGAGVASLQEEVQQHEKALGKILLAFAHRARHVHETKHHRAGVR